MLRCCSSALKIWDTETPSCPAANRRPAFYPCLSAMSTPKGECDVVPVLNSAHHRQGVCDVRGTAALIFNPVLDGGEWLALRAGRFTPEEKAPIPIEYEAGWLPYPVLNLCGKRKFFACAGNRKFFRVSSHCTHCELLPLLFTLCTPWKKYCLMFSRCSGCSRGRSRRFGDCACCSRSAPPTGFCSCRNRRSGVSQASGKASRRFCFEGQRCISHHERRHQYNRSSQ